LRLVNTFSREDKKFFLRDQDKKIDKGIRKLTDAINSFSDFVTINSCQGALISEEAENHCPLTYIDFYVLNDEYADAEMLLIKLISRFGNSIECSLRYEADFDFIDENTVEDNGYVNLRFRILLNDLEIYDELVNYIDKEFY
jgi:hypothetical protein